MSRRTQLTTKYLFQVLAQLSENFIFIYLGLSLFTETKLVFRPVLILVVTVGICLARWAAVFPLSKFINFVIRKRTEATGRAASDEIPHSYQAMLFWAGLRGAVGVALAAGFTGDNGNSLRATVLVVVVLTVIVFGGTTARMLEILGIKTGVVEEPDSDDEFDIETAGRFYKSGANGFDGFGNNTAVALGDVSDRDRDRSRNRGRGRGRGYASGQQRRGSSPARSPATLSGRPRRGTNERELLHDSDGVDSDSSDLPPPAPRRATLSSSAGGVGGVGSMGVISGASAAVGLLAGEGTSNNSSSSSSGTPGLLQQHHHNHHQQQQQQQAGSASALSQLTGIFSGTSDDQAEWFRKIDEGFIKPKLLLDQGGSSNSGGGSGSNGKGRGGEGPA